MYIAVNQLQIWGKDGYCQLPNDPLKTTRFWPAVQGDGQRVFLPRACAPSHITRAVFQLEISALRPHFSSALAHAEKKYSHLGSRHQDSYSKLFSKTSSNS
jgi:hypothetical protein